MFDMEVLISDVWNGGGDFFVFDSSSVGSSWICMFDFFLYVIKVKVFCCKKFLCIIGVLVWYKYQSGYKICVILVLVCVVKYCCLVGVGKLVGFF